jgi:hypothetical protein
MARMMPERGAGRARIAYLPMQKLATSPDGLVVVFALGVHGCGNGPGTANRSPRPTSPFLPDQRLGAMQSDEIETPAAASRRRRRRSQGPSVLRRER